MYVCMHACVHRPVRSLLIRGPLVCVTVVNTTRPLLPECILTVSLCVHAYMYLCMYACVYVHMNVCMHIYIYIYMHVCMRYAQLSTYHARVVCGCMCVYRDSANIAYVCYADVDTKI